MKKTLGLEIEKLAKKLLMADGDFNVSQTKQTVGLLFEKLVLLENHHSQGDTQKPTAGIASLDSKSYREENWFKEPEPVPQSQHQNDLVEPLMEKIKDLVAQMPPGSQKVDALLEDILPAKKYIKNDLEEFASNYQEMPTFERKTKLVDAPEPQEKPAQKENKISEKPTAKISEKPKSINDAVRGLAIGLNDRIAFIKHLFNDSVEDYDRVLSQLNSFETYIEADAFLVNQVKPEYNQWQDKDEFVIRFMSVIEKRFN